MLALLILAQITAVAQNPIVVFDAEKCFSTLGDDSVLKYDTLKLVVSAQGIVNRIGPRLLLRFLPGAGQDGPINLDDYWLSVLRKGWLSDRSPYTISSIEALMTLFPEAFSGVVIWDPDVPATANVAATICGAEGWLPIRVRSPLYRQLVETGPRLPIKHVLVGRFDGSETGSPKCDAYLWAKRAYLDKGLCNDGLMAYYIDAYTQRPGEAGLQYPDLEATTLANHDYFIARRAFFFDLGPWNDEAPVDDPKQKPGTDRETLRALLKSMYGQNHGTKMTTVGGFVPWNLKYTSSGPAGGKHEPVPTEWEYAALLSAYNAIMDADAPGIACLTNASAYMHCPLAPRYTQKPRPEQRPLEGKTYVLVYMGDYDSAAWLSRAIPVVWDDPVRGQLPIAWAFNPNLADRVPYVFDHVFKTKTPNDWLIAGDSGAGYLNPNLLIGSRLDSGIPDALDLWVMHNRAYYQRFDISITGFVINGFHGDMPLRVQQAYAAFSPDGAGMQLGYEKPIVNGTPFLRHASDIYPDLGNLEKTAAEMARFAKPEKPQFLIFRMILQKPATVKAIRDVLVAKYPEHRWDFCDPYTFFDFYKRSLTP